MTQVKFPGAGARFNGPMKILLAADGSEYTRKAAAYITKHGGWLKEPPEIFVHTVHPPLPYAAAAAVVGKHTIDDYYDKECQANLLVACRELDAAGVKHSDSYTVGEISKEIRDFVARHGIDLVVIGSHGHGALANVALGSVATKLIATLSVPILVVR